MVRETVSGLVGLEIQAEDGASITARTMLDVGDLSTEQTLVQMELTALSMHETAVEALLANDGDLAREVSRQDDDVDRLFRLLGREFQQSLLDAGLADVPEGPIAADHYHCAREIERVADCAADIASVARRSSSPPSDRVAADASALAGRSRRIVRRARYGLLDGDNPNDLGAVRADAREIIEAAEALDRSLYEDDYPEAPLLGTVVDRIVRTVEHGIDIAEAGLQATMRDLDAPPDERVDEARHV